MQKSLMQCNQIKFLLYLLVSLMLTVNLIACGSSGGGDTTVGQTPGDKETVELLTGVAATGNAMTGNVSLKDIEGTVLGPKPIASDGSFSFNVYSLVPPYFLVADDGNGNRLYSVAMSYGIANINPFTNLAVAAAAGVTDPADAYDNPGENPISQDSINQTLNELLEILEPLLHIYGATGLNPLTDPFTIGSGLDVVLDDLEVDIDTVSGSVIFLHDLFGNIGETDINAGLNSVNAIELVISGTGITDFGAILQITRDLTKSFQGLDGEIMFYDPFFRDMTSFASTFITGITESNGIATITGEASVNGSSGFTFTAIITDDTTDEIYMEIRTSNGSLFYELPSEGINQPGEYEISIQ